MALLVLFLIIDAGIAWYFYREAFVVRSNKSRQYRKWLALMLAVIAGALVLQHFNLDAARWVAGIPACLIGGVAALLAVTLMTSKGPWR